MESFQSNFGKYFRDKPIDDFLDQIPKDERNNELRYLLKLFPYVEYFENTQPNQIDGRRLCQIIIDSEIIKDEQAKDLQFIMDLKEGWYSYLEENDDIIDNESFTLTSIMIVYFYVLRPSLKIEEFVPSPMQNINFKIPKEDSDVVTLVIGETNELIIVDPSNEKSTSKSLFLEDESSFEKLLLDLGIEETKPNLFIDHVLMPIFKTCIGKK